MHGTNEVAKARTQTQGFLVHSIWHTIQGEGPLTGTPAIFVRLAGCNLRCSFCDTDFGGGAEMSAGELCAKIMMIANGFPDTSLVVFTGGEPMLQPLPDIINPLLLLDFEVQVETAGTVWPDGFYDLLAKPAVHIVVSPKTPKLHPLVDTNILDCSLKYIIIAGQVDDKDGLPLGVYRPRSSFLSKWIFVQPCDEGPDAPGKTQMNMEAATASALAHGYRVSIQTHKIMGVP